MNAVIKNRLQKNYQRLSNWAKKNGYDAFRLYDLDIPEYPFLIDLYGPHVVLHDKSRPEFERDQKHLQETLQALCELFKISLGEIIVKRRLQQRVEGKDQQYSKISETDHKLVISEGLLKYYVNLNDYIDTGIFLDHRPLRQKILKTPSTGNFLNLFSYTCSMSLAAAKAGMRTSNIDLSQRYLAWGKENFLLNGFDPEKHEFLNLDVLGYFHPITQKQFDLIFLDPPTFSNSKKMTEDLDVERDQVLLVDQCMQRLAPGGLLLFSNNKRGFKLAKEITEKYEVKDISKETIPQDFHQQSIHKCFEIRSR